MTSLTIDEAREILNIYGYIPSKIKDAIKLDYPMEYRLIAPLELF